MAGAVAGFGALSGCGSSARVSGDDSGQSNATRGLDRSERYVQNSGARAPSAQASATVAMVDGMAVVWADLRAPLSEAAGGMVLEEVVLERLLERECARAGIVIDASDVAREQALLAETMAGVVANEEERLALVAQVRRSRGLGEARFAALLRRNAMLRRLVRDDVRITPSAIEQSYLLRYGPTIRARIITTTTHESAADAAARVRAGEPFGEVAARVSTDESASRGGIIEPINPADPSYPEGLRLALERTRPGELSAIVALERGFALLLREPDDASDSDAPGIDEVRNALEHDVRMRQERLLMSALARRLLGAASVNVLDPSLNRSWRDRRQE